MPTNKQRRESARRHLERQLQRRQERESRQRKVTLIVSIGGTIVLIGAIVVALVAFGSGSAKNKSLASGKSPTTTASNTTAPPTSPSPSPTPSTSYPAAKGASVTFNGVTVTGATDLKGSPGVASKSSKDATKLETKDLVVGTGKAATPASSVTVQYTGVLYKKGTVFDSSWLRGMPAQFSLAPGGVIAGFTQGIAGTTGVAAMKVGGRRIIILPASLGYKNQASGAIPANSALVFVVDLKGVTS